MTTRKDERSYRTLAMSILTQLIKEGVKPLLTKLQGDRNSEALAEVLQDMPQLVDMHRAYAWLQSLPEESCAEVEPFEDELCTKLLAGQKLTDILPEVKDELFATEKKEQV